MTHWEVVDKTVPQFAVAEFDGDEKLHEHPIYFTDRREAERAASRLNVRDHLPGEPS